MVISLVGILAITDNNEQSKKRKFNLFRLLAMALIVVTVPFMGVTVMATLEIGKCTCTSSFSLSLSLSPSLCLSLSVSVSLSISLSSF